jgi:hypothetical protein
MLCKDIEWYLMILKWYLKTLKWYIITWRLKYIARIHPFFKIMLFKDIERWCRDIEMLFKDIEMIFKGIE